MDSRRLVIYYRRLPERDRWVLGDRFARPIIRRVIRGKHRMGGLDKVAFNLKLGLEEIGEPYIENPPFRQLRPSDRVVFLGVGRECFRGYSRTEPIVAGLGIMTHPRQFPELCERFPVVRFLQASEWSADLYRPYFGDRCAVWPVGIDTERWRPLGLDKTFDFLVYDKLRVDVEAYQRNLIRPIEESLKAIGASFRVIRYGHYTAEEYADSLARCRAMIFVCSHESQGIAYQEALSSGIPILAWDGGLCLDPEQANDDGTCPPATSVPYFDSRCGLKFKGSEDFSEKAREFIRRLDANEFSPREYILENLTLAKCAAEFVRLVKEAI